MMQQSTDSAGNSGAAGSMSFSRIVGENGNQMIDGLLSGVAWTVQRLNISYPTSGSFYGNNYSAGENTSGFQAATQNQMKAANYGFVLVQQYTNLQFFQINEGFQGTAHIRIANFAGTSPPHGHDGNWNTRDAAASTWGCRSAR